MSPEGPFLSASIVSSIHGPYASTFVYTPGTFRLPQPIPKLTIPTWYQRSSFSQTKGPPPSPYNIKTIMIVCINYAISLKNKNKTLNFLLHLNILTSQASFPSEPAQRAVLGNMYAGPNWAWRAPLQVSWFQRGTLISLSTKECSDAKSRNRYNSKFSDLLWSYFFNSCRQLLIK